MLIIDWLFSYFLESSFPQKMEFSKTFISGAQTIFSNWILEEAMNNGGWKCQFFSINGLKARKDFLSLVNSLRNLAANYYISLKIY